MEKVKNQNPLPKAAAKQLRNAVGSVTLGTQTAPSAVDSETQTSFSDCLADLLSESSHRAIGDSIQGQLLPSLDQVDLYMKVRVTSRNSDGEVDNRTGIVVRKTKRTMCIRPDDYTGLASQDGLVEIPSGGWKIASIHKL